MNDIADCLAAAVGSAAVTQPDPEQDWQTLAGTALAESAVAPQCRVMPETAADLAKVIELAALHRWRILPTGQSSKLSWGGLGGGAEILLSTARLNRVIEHAVGDFTITVEAGLRFSELKERLAAAGQFLAIDPLYADQATIGGIVATADTGAYRQRYGGVRDRVIGIEFVRYDGQIVKAGGRVVKNVAGYDLMKLLTGSYGTLGVITALTLRLYPRPLQSRTVLLRGAAADIAAAVQQVRQSGLTPAALDLLLVTPTDQARPLVLATRLQGIIAGVAEQTQRLEVIAKPLALAWEELDGAADEQFWHQLSARLQGVKDTVLCKVGMQPTEMVSFLAQVQQAIGELDGMARLHAGSGLGLLLLSVDRAGQVLPLRSRCTAAAGFLTVLEAPHDLKQKLDVWGYNGSALATMRSLKDHFDPQRLLSPGRFVGGL